MKMLEIILNKDIRELKNNQKLMRPMILLILFPLIANIIVTHPIAPILPKEYVLISAMLLTAACLGSELTYYLMINEIKYETFDMILLSNTHKFKILIYKLLIPCMISILLSFLGLLIYYTVPLLFPTYHLALGTFNIGYIPLIITASIVSCMIEFGSMMVIGKSDKNIHTQILFLSLTISIIGYVLSVYVGLFYIFYSLTIIMIILIMNYKLIDYYKSAIKYSKKYKKSLFPNRRISQLKALIIKNLILSKFKWYILIPFFGISIIPLLAQLIPLSNQNLAPLLYYISFYFICIFGSINVLYPSIATERIAKISDILKVAKISKQNKILLNIVFPIAFLLLGFLISTVISLFYSINGNAIIIISIAALFICILSSLFSVLITLWLSKHVNTYKDIRVVHFVIMILSLMAHVALSFIIIML